MHQKERAILIPWLKAHVTLCGAWGYKFIMPHKHTIKTRDMKDTLKVY